MKTTYLDIVLLTILFMGVVSVPYMTYDPKGADNTAVSTLLKQQDGRFAWFHQVVATSPALSYKMTLLDKSEATKKKTVTYTPTNTNTVKSISGGLNCALFFDSIANPNKMSAYKFETSSVTATLVNEIISAGLISSSDASKQFEVADLCNAIKIDSNIYHFTPGTGYAPDTVPAWTSPVLSSDFSYVAAADGIYQYDSTGKSYSKIYSTTHYQSKKIWKVDSKLLIFSWADSIVSGETNLKNYKIEAFSISGNTLTQAGLIEGKSYDETAGAGPSFSISLTLQTFVVYGQNASATIFVKGKTINYSNNTSVDLVFPELITGTSSYVTVSDTFIYARNKVNKIATSYKYHGGYQIFGANLVKYFETTMVSSETTLWTRSFLSDTSSKELLVYREHVDVGAIRIEQQLHNLEGQIMRWDKTNGGANNIATLGASFSQAEFAPKWFLESIVTAGKQFKAAYLHPTTNVEIYVTLSASATHSLKVSSNDKKCAVIYESTAATLKVYNFDKTSTSTISLSDGVLIGSSLYSGVDIITLDAASWQVADNCKALRISSKIMRWNNSANTFVLVAFPTNSTFTNSMFTHQFLHVITDDAIYRFESSSNDSVLSYTLERTQQNYSKKKVWQYSKNIVIFTQRQTSPGSNLFDWKLQFNAIVNLSLALTSVGQFSGQSSDLPSISVSQKVSKVIVYGKSSSNTSQPFYVSKTIDFDNKVVKDISFPSEITNAFNEVTCTDEFLYIRNKNGQLRHFGYIVMGSRSVQQFNQTVSLLWTVDYVRSFILPDPLNGRMIIASQLNSDPWIRIVKSQRKSPSEVINPNRIPPYEMTFSYDATGTFKRQVVPKFGKWLSTSDGGRVLVYTEYDPSIADTKKKSFTKSALSAGTNVILDVTPDFDCALTSVTGSALDVVQIFPSNNSMSIINVYSRVMIDFITAANVSSAINQKKVKIGPLCWALKFGQLIYVKNSTNDGFYKQSTSGSAGFNTAIYDDSLKFALVNNTVYKYQDVDYATKFTVNGLSPIREIFSSEDQNKLFIVSYEVLTVPSGSPNKVSGSAKLFANNGTAWNEVPLNLTFTNVLRSSPPFVFESSSNFQRIGFGVYNLTASRLGRLYIDFIEVNYTSNSFITYRSVPEFEQTQVALIFVIYGNYLYYLKHVILENYYVQYTYKFDPLNRSIVEIGRNNVDPSFAESLYGGQLKEQNNLIFATFQVQQSMGTITVMKRLYGGTGIQTILKGIQTLQSGVVIIDNILVLCSPGCAYCVNPTSCSSCQSGFLLNSNNVCIKCGGQCKTCTSSDLDRCITCYNGFYLQGNSICLRCHDECLTCSSSSVSDCLSCKVGFYVNTTTSTGNCAACIENCVKCMKNSTDADALCQNCKLGFVYHPTAKKCVKCISGCIACKYDKIHQCEACGDGFEPILVNGTLTQCKNCSQNCRKCESGNCTDCRQGFRPFDGACVQRCKLPCSECSSTNSSNCTACMGGFILETNECKPDFTCNTTSNCSTCPLGYNLISGNCYKCNGGDNCRTCQNTNIEKCSSCIKGYYLTTTATCTPCTTEGCAHCRDEFYCLQCQPGHTLSGTSESSKCIKCHESCATCFEEPNNCDVCAENFTKRGWKCVTTSNVKFDFRLDANFSALTTEQFVDIERTIFTAVGKDSSNVNIEELKEGSVVFSGTIDASNATQQSTLVNTLAVAFSSGVTLGGFGIQSSSFTSQNYSAVPAPPNNDDEERRKRNLAIILGVVIPGVIIIALIVMFVLKKRGIICKRKVEPSPTSNDSFNQMNNQNIQKNEDSFT